MQEKQFMKHRSACPQKYDAQDDCMCEYIAPRKKNSSILINKAHVRKLALEVNPKFRRVGQSFFDAIDRMTKQNIERLAAAQKRGVTLK